MGWMRNVVAAVVIGFVWLAGSGCSVTPEQELQLGRQNHGKFEQEAGGRYPDPGVQAYVSSVGMQMARLAGRPDMQWQFHVLNSDQINAFAVPGGYIYITRGLLFRLKSESELAGVLGHEAGHIAARHSARQIETSQTVGLLSAGVSILAEQAGYAVGKDVSEAAAGLYLMRYSREHETEADYLGLKYMVSAGYNPTGMIGVMQTLKAASGGAKSGPLGEWTSTHPDPGNRIGYLTQEIRSKYAAAAQTGRTGDDEFRRNVLSRRQAALPPIRPGDVLWCLDCRRESGAVAALTGAEPLTGTELLRDVR
jgi:beta-barrel assembly-enhancing protease